jgi:hypothetical protein
MGKDEASVEEIVGVIERGELRLPEMQQRYVWRSQVSIALDHPGCQRKLQFHHIFPKAVLKTIQAARQTTSQICASSLGRPTARSSDRPPKAYFPPMIEKSGLAAFEAQCILPKPSLLGIEELRGLSPDNTEVSWHNGSINF